MRKKMSLIFLSMLLVSLFSSLSFVSSASSNLILNSTFDSSIAPWDSSNAGSWICSSSKAKHKVTYQTNIYHPFITIDRSKTQTLYFDDYDIDANNDMIQFQFSSSGGYYIYVGPGVTEDHVGTDKSTAWSLPVSTLNGMTLAEIWDTYGGPSWDPLSTVTLGDNKVKIWFLATKNTATLDNVYLWEDVSKTDSSGNLLPYCGDGSCNGTETCSTCSADCGACFTGTVGHFMEPETGDPNEFFTGTVYLNNQTVYIDDSNVTLTISGVPLVTSNVIQDVNAVKYIFRPVDNNLDYNDVASILATVRYNGSDYTGAVSFTCSAPDQDPDHSDYNNSKIVGDYKFTFNFTKDNYELNEKGNFVNLNAEKVGGVGSVVDWYAVLNLTTPDGQAGGGLSNYTYGVNMGIIQAYPIIRVGANEGVMKGTCTFYYKDPPYVGTLKSVVLTDTATVGTVSNNPSSTSGQDETIIEKIKNIPQKVIDAVKTVGSTFYDAVKTVASDGYNAVTTVASDVAEAAKEPVETVIDLITDAGEGVAKTVEKVVSGGSSATSGIGSALGFLKGSLFGIPVWLIGVVILGGVIILGGRN